MKKMFGRVLVLCVVVMLSISACAVKPSTPSEVATSTPEVMPTVEPTEAVARYSCPDIDPNVEYSVSGIGKVLFFCDAAGYVRFVGDDDTTIIGRVGLSTYKPSSGEFVEVRAKFDQVDSKDNAVIRHMDNCFIEGQAIAEFPVSEAIDKITYQSVRCSNAENTDVEVVAWYNVRPISEVLESQPRYVGEILNWEETNVGDQLVFCDVDDPFNAYVHFFPADAIQQFLPGHEAIIVGCFPGTVEDVESRRISYQGYALKNPSYNDPESNVIYVMDEERVVGGYPFVSRDQLLTGKAYLLCQVPDVHEPQFESYEVQNNFFSEDSLCVLGVYQGIKATDDTTVPVEEIVTLWTVYGTLHQVKNLDGAFISPIQ